MSVTGHFWRSEGDLAHNLYPQILMLRYRCNLNCSIQFKYQTHNKRIQAKTDLNWLYAHLPIRVGKVTFTGPFCADWETVGREGGGSSTWISQDRVAGRAGRRPRHRQRHSEGTPAYSSETDSSKGCARDRCLNPNQVFESKMHVWIYVKCQDHHRCCVLRIEGGCMEILRTYRGRIVL